MQKTNFFFFFLAKADEALRAKEKSEEDAQKRKEEGKYFCAALTENSFFSKTVFIVTQVAAVMPIVARPHGLKKRRLTSDITTAIENIFFKSCGDRPTLPCDLFERI